MRTRLTQAVISAGRVLLMLAGLSVAVALPAAAQTSAVPATSAPVSSSQLEGAKLLNALRGGGYVLYFRHTSTDFGANDDNMTSYADCATQRNLTEQGRTEARRIGAAIKSLAIPIGKVMASPFCRTMETAQLMFGRAVATPAVRGGPAQADAERYADLRKLLSTPVERDSNAVIASHGNPFRAVVGGAYLAEGEAAVVEPRGAEGFRVVARVRKDDWATLSTAPP
jgi:broad specificity phosphatase PhoE